VAGRLLSDSDGAEGSVTTRECARAAVSPRASATSRVKLNVPAALAVPAITPLEPFSARPVGSAPADKRNVNGAVPPTATKVKVYAVPATAFGSAAGVENVSPERIVRLNAFCVVSFAASVRVTVKLNVPVVVAVPESAPVGATNPMPGGSVPAVTVKTYG